MQVPPSNSFDPVEYERAQAISQFATLRTFALVYGWLILLSSCFFSIYIFLGVSFILDPHAFDTNEAAPSFGPMMFLLIGIGGTIAAWTIGGMSLFAAKCLRIRRHWTFVIVFACIICLNMPFGTALGVYMLIVLTKLPAKMLFDAQRQIGVG